MEAFFSIAVILVLALGKVEGQYYYGEKCYLTDDPLDVREAIADVVFTGRVLSLHKNPYNSTYYCSISIYRVIKGSGIVAGLLEQPSSALNNKAIEVAGFGSDQICDSDVEIDDTRIFLASYHRLTNLTLNSSLTRVSVRSLQKSLAGKSYV